MIRTRLARATLLAVVAWLVGALTAVTVGLIALSSVGTGLFGQPTDPLVQAGDPIPPGGPTAAASAGSTAQRTGTGAPGADQPLDSPGGTVVARCDEGGVYLTFWSPAQGFHVDDVIRGPAAVARVKFESTTWEVTMKITCTDGIAHSSTHQEWSGHR